MTGAALGLRGYVGRLGRVRGLVDFRLQAGNLPGPCTVLEARQGICEASDDGSSVGDVGLSLGIGGQLVGGVHGGLLFSPGILQRGWDRLEGGEHANRSARPLALGAVLEARMRGDIGVFVEYRHLWPAEFVPDSQARARLGALPLEATGRSISIGASIPLRPAGPRRPTPPTDAEALTMFGLVIENDLLWTDESYTNGLRAVIAEVPVVRTALRYAHAGFEHGAPACPYRGTLRVAVPYCRATSLSLSQTIHTPVSIYDRPSQPGDRPFAGTLFVAARSDLLHPQLATHPYWSLGTELQLGVLGSAAGSAHTQRMAHWLIATGAPRPDGWDRQLPNTFHALLMVDGALRLAATRSSVNPTERGLSADVTVRASQTVGTTHSGTGIGITARFSPFCTTLPLTLVRAIAPSITLAAAPAADTLDATSRSRFALVAGADVRAVWHNRTLDGSGVERQQGLLELSGGAQWEFRSMSLAFLVMHRSREFTRTVNPTPAFARHFTLQVMYRPQ